MHYGWGENLWLSLEVLQIWVSSLLMLLLGRSQVLEGQESAQEGLLLL